MASIAHHCSIALSIILNTKAGRGGSSLLRLGRMLQLGHWIAQTPKTGDLNRQQQSPGHTLDDNSTPWAGIVRLHLRTKLTSSPSKFTQNHQNLNLDKMTAAAKTTTAAHLEPDSCCRTGSGGWRGRASCDRGRVIGSGCLPSSYQRLARRYLGRSRYWAATYGSRCFRRRELAMIDSKNLAYIKDTPEQQN